MEVDVEKVEADNPDAVFILAEHTKDMEEAADLEDSKHAVVAEVVVAVEAQLSR